MKERIKELRKALGLSQETFADRIGLKGSAVSHLEIGRRNITNQTITAICQKFNVNEEWLRNGTGGMFREMSRAEEAAQIVSSSLDKLSSDEWAFVKRILLKLR